MFKFKEQNSLHHHGPSYTSHIFNPEYFPKTVKACIKTLKLIWKKEGPFFAIAGCGNSSLPLLGAISVVTEIPFIAVRKPGDPAHDTRMVNGPIKNYDDKKKVLKYVFVDDLVSTGKTFLNVYEHLKVESDAEVKCIAMLNYSEDYYEHRHTVEIYPRTVTHNKNRFGENSITIGDINIAGEPLKIPCYYAQKFMK